MPCTASKGEKKRLESTILDVSFHWNSVRSVGRGTPTTVLLFCVGVGIVLVYRRFRGISPSLQFLGGAFMLHISDVNLSYKNVFQEKRVGSDESGNKIRRNW
jgi:hypothetical protein